MKQLMVTEFKRMLNKRTILIIFLLCILSIGSYFFVYEKQSDEFYTELITQLEMDVQTATVNMDYLKSEEKELDGKEKKYNKKLLSIWEKEYQYTDAILMCLKADDLDQYEQTIIELFHQRDENIAFDVDDKNLSILLRNSKKDFQQRRALYDEYQKEGKLIHLNPYVPTCSNLVKSLGSSSPFLLLSLLVVLVLNADVWSYEFSSSGYKLLFTSPFKKSNIYFAKSIVHFLVTTITMLLVLAIPLLLSMYFHGGGYQGLEVIQNYHSDVINIVSSKTYAMYVLIIYVMYLFMAFSAVSFISYITKDVMLSYALPILLAGIVYINCQNIFSLFKYDFTSYYLGNDILHGNIQVDYFRTVLMLFGIGLFLHILSLHLLKRRDISDS